MAIHLSACRHGLPLRIGVRVELGEVLLNRQQAEGHHQGLVPIIPAAKIAGLELTGQGELGHLLAVSENAEFGLSSQDFLAAKQGSFTADAGQFVIVEGHLSEVLTSFKRESLSHGR